jgi:hypothetical protein
MTPREFLDFPLSFIMYWLFLIGGSAVLITMIVSTIIYFIDIIINPDKER